MRSTWRLVTLIGLTLLPLQAVAEDSAAQLLEKGIYLEETVGDVAGATEVYGQLVAKDKAEAGLMAQAYYRLGTCLLKQGKTDEASEKFNQLMERFPDETTWVRKARAELTRLNKASGPPRVVRTSPAAFEQNVSADVDKLTVTFNQAMTDKSWSWTGGGDTYPKTTDAPSYNSTRTVCTMPIKLEPGKVYWVGINSPSHRNFKSARGAPAQRYVILFATAGTDGKPTEIPKDMLEEAKRINSAAPAGGDASQPIPIKTEPEAFKGDVSASLDKITVTFDRPMTDKSWSWTGGGETYPKTTAAPSYDTAKTTCTMPVQLEPGKVYWVGINSPSHRNFRSAEGAPAPWYVILFATADADGKPTEIPRDMLEQARKINKGVMHPASQPARGKVPAASKAKAK